MDTEALQVLQIAALAAMCEQLKVERDEMCSVAASTLASHVTDGLMRLNRLGVKPGPGLVEAAETLLARGKS